MYMSQWTGSSLDQAMGCRTLRVAEPAGILNCTLAANLSEIYIK